MIGELLLIAALAGEPADRAVWRYDCESIRRQVEQLGEHAVVAIARARGVPQTVIEDARRRCRQR